ncbi:MOSC domain-containing protein [Maritalea sp.]|uniref:MOSC domain-containing protein n=1 Tax=Maritalea sp. TaxID=2003361 RepID=UPI003EF28E6B
MTVNTKVLGLFVGKAKERWPGKPPSAIAKFAANRAEQLIETGFVVDEQADARVHGGPEKAVHHYPSDHYSNWLAEKFDTSFAFKAGAFGENISTAGVTEEDVCLGDIFSLGTARVQISQGRQPCWKLNMHTRFPDMAINLQNSGRTGWYYRVLNQGEVKVGDKFELVDRLHEAWPMDQLIAARFNKQLDPLIAKDLSQIDELASNWRQYFFKRANKEAPEDQTPRLMGTSQR